MASNAPNMEFLALSYGWEVSKTAKIEIEKVISLTV